MRWPRRRARRWRPSVTVRCSSSPTSSALAMSRCRSSVTRSATSSTSVSASVDPAAKPEGRRGRRHRGSARRRANCKPEPLRWHGTSATWCRHCRILVGDAGELGAPQLITFLEVNICRLTPGDRGGHRLDSSSAARRRRRAVAVAPDEIVPRTTRSRCASSPRIRRRLAAVDRHGDRLRDRRCRRSCRHWVPCRQHGVGRLRLAARRDRPRRLGCRRPVARALRMPPVSVPMRRRSQRSSPIPTFSPAARRPHSRSTRVLDAGGVPVDDGRPSHRRGSVDEAANRAAARWRSPVGVAHLRTCGQRCVPARCAHWTAGTPFEYTFRRDGSTLDVLAGTRRAPAQTVYRRRSSRCWCGC